MKSVIQTTLLILICTIILCGCSGKGDSSNPVIPDETVSTPELTGSADISGSIDENNHYLLLYNMIYVNPSDPNDVKVEIVPVRLGELHLNILKFLEVGPCTDCFRIVGFNFPEPDVLDVDIEITHPFIDKTYTVFDVRGIMMFQGSRLFPTADKTTSDPSLGDGALLNADGYTALYNGNTIDAPTGDLQKYFPGNFSTQTIPDSDINGFVRYITDDPGNTRNALYAGDSVTNIFSIKLPEGPFVLGYAVDANWAQPTIPVTDPMEDFPPEANSLEPWKVEITEEPIDDGLTNNGGETKLLIDVYDWQGMDTYHDPVVECPELFDDTLTATWLEDGPDYSRYEVTVPNENLAPVANYMCLVGVEANENNPALWWLDLTAYQLQLLTVAQKEFENPIAVATADPNPQLAGQPVHFSGVDSYDPDGGGIEDYEWDLDYDSGVGFVPDDNNMEHDHTWDVAGTYYVQLQVTDDEGETDLLDEPLEIIITEHLPPDACGEGDPLVQIVGEPIHFTDCGSVAYDGAEIVLNEWDWDYDSDVGFVPDEVGTDVYHTWDIPGIYYVQYRVTDDEGATDELDEPLEIVIGIDYMDPIACGEAIPLTTVVCEPVHFTDCGSYDPDGGLIVKWEWDWENDGVYDEEGTDLYHTWNIPGTYYVQFRVTDDEDATDELDDPIEITITHENPSAVAEPDKTNVEIDEDITFNASQSHDNDCDGQAIEEYAWDLDYDDSFDPTKFGMQITHSYPQYGTYSVVLRVTDDEGGTDFADPIEILVNSDPVVEIISIPDETCHCFTFDISGCYDPDGGEIVLFEWDWDDDGIYDESGTDVFHCWDIPGTYYFRIRITDDEGSWTEEQVEINIANELPTAMALASTETALVCEEITFDGSQSYDGDCDGYTIVSWEWDFDNDGEYDDEGEIVQYSFNNVGLHTVQLRVTDDEGSIDELDQPIEITAENALPTAIAEAYQDSPDDLTIDFDGSASHDNDCDGCCITIWEWDWDNDGVYDSAGPVVDHTWDAAGTYYVQMKVTDDEDGTDELDEPLEIMIMGIEVTVPNGGERWQAGCDREITWTSVNLIGTVFIDYSTDNFVSDINSITTDEPNDGSFMWENIPSDYSDTVRVRVSSTNYPNVNDISNENFSIVESAGWEIKWGDAGYAVAVDSDGNVYVTGTDGGAFLARFDSCGELQWERTWGGEGWAVGRGVAVDGSGNVYVTGYFYDTVDFDPGGGDPHTPNGSDDVFLSRFDSLGNYNGVLTWGGTGMDHGYGVAVDGLGNVYVTGEFKDKVDFDPGPGKDEHSSDPPWREDVFLSKFDSSGNFQWALTWGGTFKDHGYGVAVDGSGNVYVTGDFHLTVDFDPGDGTDEHISNGEYDVFLSKFDSLGSFQWARTWGGNGGDLDWGLGVAADGSGNVYVTGCFAGTVDFDPGPGTDEHSSNGPYNVFLSKFNSSGVFQWARTWGGTGTDYLGDIGHGVAADPSGNIYVTGRFYDTVDFDPGGWTDDHTSNGDWDAFLSKFDSSGAYQWARTWGGAEWDRGYGVAVDGSGNAYTTGTGYGWGYAFLTKHLPDGCW